DEEFVIVQRVTGPEIPVSAVCTTEPLGALQRGCRRIFVDPSLIRHAVRLVAATREPARFGLAEQARFVSFGASPRATIALIEGARALACLRGRRYALPDDVTDLVADVLRHRIVLSYEALAEGVTADTLVARIMRQLPAPDMPLE